VDVGAAVVADEQPLELVEPGEGAFDDPAVAAEAGAVGGLAAGDLWCDAALAELTAVFVVVVAAVGRNTLGSAAWTADAPAYRWYALDERDQLGDVVAVAAGQRPGEREPARVDEEMVFRAGPATIDRARARLGAPFFACTWLESATARDQSISSIACNRSSRTPCSFSQTPAFCHSSRRRQQVAPEPKPSSSGRCSQAIPVCSTNRIPHRHSRLGNRFRPG
jgi:hypothetical protein